MSNTRLDNEALKESNIIFFDGVCTLCNSSVDFIMRKDKNHVFYYASLQSKTAKKLLGSHGINLLEPDSIVYYRDGKTLVKSNAVLGIGRLLHFPYNGLVILKIVPRFIRDFFYDIIAKNRYNWFGKRSTCRLPTESERAFFLD